MTDKENSKRCLPLFWYSRRRARVVICAGDLPRKQRQSRSDVVLECTEAIWAFCVKLTALLNSEWRVVDPPRKADFRPLILKTQSGLDQL